jgi:hypothetical protein
MAGTWRNVTNQPSFTVDTMLLLTDGSVMCHEYSTPNWHRLVPNAASDYGNGSWQPVAPMPANAPATQNGPANAPLYFASALLKDGRVFVAGGEYNGDQSVDLLAAELYDPVADTWTSLPTPDGWTNIGDAPSCVLPDGKVILGNINNTSTAIFDPATDTWAAGPNKHDPSSEETWTLLPGNAVLAAEVMGHPNAEKYLVASNEWVNAASTPPGHDLVLSVPGVSIEIGPAILLPDRRVFAIGATGHTAVYVPHPFWVNEPGTWWAGPDFPEDGTGNLLRAFDAPACLLPNGRVLCVAGGVQPDLWAGTPSRFFEFDGRTLTEVSHPASAANAPTYNCRLLVLPTGEVLLSTCTEHLDIYQPDGGPDPDWRPVIVNAPTSVARGETYQLAGLKLNGLSQANSYGDDAQMATNYPIARIRDGTTGTISYLHTSHHSTMGLGAWPVLPVPELAFTSLTVPDIPVGDGQLSVIANGIESATRPVTVT